MCYTITILGLLCCTYLPAPSLRDASDVVRLAAIGTETGITPTGGTRHPGLIAQRAQTTTPDRKEPAPAKQDATPQMTEQTRGAPEQSDKKSPPKNFVPSEKIDADKAVDFPADI